MFVSARRAWGLALLVTLAAPPAMMVGDANAATSGSSVHASPANVSAARSTSARRHRRVRRAPPGGVVWARNAVVLDAATGDVLYEKNAERSVPIASLTKLMTAMVFLEQKPDMDREVEVTGAELF